MGTNKNFHSYFTFSFPKFDVPQSHLGKNGMGQIYASNASLNNDSNNPSTCLHASDILPRSDSTRITTPSRSIPEAERRGQTLLT